MTELAYQKAGVNIALAKNAKDKIKKLARSTHTKNVLKEIGLFSGFYELDLEKYKRPVLVSSIDGVGTKVKIAQMMGVYDTIGMDLVNHCVNDIIVCGAEPIFFMDYIAADKLDMNVVQEIVQGISAACKDANCALVGGETAEMPGVYLHKNFDLAGSIVGVIEKSEIIDGSKVKTGDVLIGVASNGLHTNGYSLVRKVFFEDHKLQATDYLSETQSTLGEELLKTHRSYLDLIKTLKTNPGLHGIAHITGGGIVGNTTRILRDGLTIDLNWSAWEWPAIFKILQKRGSISDREMQQVFNLGIGLVIVGEEKQANSILNICQSNGEDGYIIGSVVSK